MSSVKRKKQFLLDCKMETVIKNGQLSYFKHEEFYKDSVDDLLKTIEDLNFYGSQWKTSKLSISDVNELETDGQSFTVRCLKFHDKYEKNSYYLLPQPNSSPSIFVISEKNGFHNSQHASLGSFETLAVLFEAEPFQIYWGGILALLVRSKHIDTLLKRHILTLANSILADYNFMEKDGFDLDLFNWLNNDGYSISSLVQYTENEDYYWD